MNHYTFPGFSAFLGAAAREIGRPEAEAPARRIATLSALANLCAQVAEAGPVHAPAVMAKAAEFRDQLHAAHRAADLMLEEVSRSLELTNKPPKGAPPPPALRFARGQEPRGKKA